MDRAQKQLPTNMQPIFLQILSLFLMLFLLGGGECQGAYPPSLPQEHPKYQEIRKVYLAVARIFSEGRQPPRLLVIPGASGGGIAQQVRGTDGLVGTSSRHEEGYIAISEKTYDLLVSANKESGLAFVLGHELAHYYMRHGWAGSFGNAFTGSKAGADLSRVLTQEQITTFEVQADYLGGLYSYLAGYNSLETAHATLDLLYSGFGIPANGKQRPTLAERKEIVTLAKKQLEQLIPAFEAATVLMLLGRYDDAAHIYDYLANAAPSREFSGNAAVARINRALELFGATENRFVFPVELDLQTRLRQSITKTLQFQPNPVEQRTALLEMAVESLEKAIALSPDYTVAHLNLATALALLGRTAEAQERAGKAGRLATKQNDRVALANALILKGITQAQSGDEAGAKKSFALASGNSRLALLNLTQLAGQPQPPQSETTASQATETIAGRTPELLAGAPRPAGSDFFLRGIDNYRLTVKAFDKEAPAWRGMVIEQGSSVKYALLRTGSSYRGKTALGVGRGADAKELEQVYGTPSRSFATRQGSFVAFDKRGIIFTLNHDQKVAGWIIFKRL